MTWLAVGLAVGLACGGALMTWWASKRIEREGARQYEIGIAEGVQRAQRDQRGKAADRPGSATNRRRRRKALQRAVRADDVA